MQNKFFGSKLNTALLVILTVLMIIALLWMYQDKEKYLPNNQVPAETLQFGEDENHVVKDTYTYTNHGFSIELPKGFVPIETESEGGPVIVIKLPRSTILYVYNADFWQENNMKGYVYVSDQKIGNTIFKFYENIEGFDISNMYLFRFGNVAYVSIDGDINDLKTFKFVGWPQQVENDKKIFVGIITALDNGCWVDGICKIQIDNKSWVTYNIGRNINQLPIGEIEGELTIGAKVEVSANKDNNIGEYTIVGDTKYYIKVIK